MAKRFTDSEKWRRPWFRALPDPYKFLWIFVLDHCDIAGLWYIDLDLASFSVGHTLERREAERLFEKQIDQVGIDRWFIRGFIDFQYGKLSQSNHFHRAVIKLLQENNLGPKVGLDWPNNGPEEKDKVKDKEKLEIEAARISDAFDIFWSRYPNKKSKVKAAEAWKKISPNECLIETIMNAISRQSSSENWQENDGKFIPHPTTWLNQRRWEDQVGTSRPVLKAVPMCRCRRNGSDYRPTVKSRNNRELVCADCRQKEDIEAGVL